MTTPACQRERGRLAEALRAVRVGAGFSGARLAEVVVRLVGQVIWIEWQEQPGGSGRVGAVPVPDQPQAVPGRGEVARAVEVTMCSPAGCRSRLAAVIAGPRAASPRSSNFSQISPRVGKAGSAVARPTITGLAAVWSCPRQVMTHQPAATMLRY